MRLDSWRFSSAVILAAVLLTAPAQSSAPDWRAVEDETMRHYQALLRLETRNPPGNEHLAVEYLKGVLDREGIAAEIVGRDPNRPNLIARLKGSGRKRPLLIMGHTDVVTVDAAKWTFPPFSATRDGGYVYGRGAVDDKDNVTGALMTMILLKRLGVPLDRDVIFVAEAGEEGGDPVGIDYLVSEQFPKIDAEYCLAEGGGVTRKDGRVAFATIQTLEKIPRRIELVAGGVSGHGSVPLKTNPVVHLAGAVARVGDWRPPIRLNETTAAYFQRLADISPPDVAQHYRDVLSKDPAVQKAADDWLFEHEPRHSSMLRTSASPNIITGGYRFNVIPSQATATIDVRLLPDEDQDAFLEQVKKVVADPAVDVRYPAAAIRPPGREVRLDSEGFRAIEAAVTRVYDTTTVPTMGTGATDMAQLRGKGVQCFGIGPATDFEDGPKGFGAHSDQERLLESELHRFVRFNWEVVTALARAR
jgi:acetylornithine deacetylase/succinyl-diaminopimelate desuccinylase-like protein